MKRWLWLVAAVYVVIVVATLSTAHGQAVGASRINFNSTCPVGNPPAGTTWACIDGSGNLACTKSDGSSCMAAGAAGVIFAPTTDQNIVQPSTGGTSLGTSLNANVIEQVRYADQFQWLQSPAGTISIGANTITINGVRGINQYSFSPGVNNFGSFTFVTHQLRIAATGTPEVVTLTSTTCTGSSSGTCTLTFTAANVHSAGYTIGTATAGFQEAIVDTFATSVANANLSGWTVKGSPYLNTHNFIFWGTLDVEQVLGVSGQTHIDCEGATLEDAVKNAAMIRIGGNGISANTWPKQTLIDHCHFGISVGNLGRAATGNQVVIWDRSQGLTLSNNNWDAAQNITDLVDNLVVVSGDQNFDFERNTINSPAMKCDATWCGWMVYGDGTNSSALGTIHDNYMNNADAINWISGNGLTIYGNVFQNWYRYPWRYQTGLTTITNLGGNYYEGSNTINPDFGVSGFSINTGPQVMVSGTVVEYSPGVERGVAGLGTHRFSSTGANLYSYYIVGNDGIGHSTRPLFIGDAATDGVTNFNILFLPFAATTYDVLRSGPAVNDGSDASPWGTGNWAVATGIVCASAPCSFTETFAAPTAYTIKAEFQSTSYSPSITYWPVPLFLNGNNLVPSVYIGPAVKGYVNSGAKSNYDGYYDAIFTSEIGGAGALTGMRILHQQPLAQSTTSNDPPGAMILNPDTQSVGMQNRKGRVNFPSLSFHGGATWTNNLLVQTYDSQPNKTFATAGHQPLLDAGDVGFGYDTDVAHQATMCGAFWCDFYVNNIPDSGVSRALRITNTGLDVPTGSAFTVNGAPQSIDLMASPGSNTEILSNQGGTPGTVAGFTVSAGGNVAVPGTLGVTGAVNGTSAAFSAGVVAASFATSGAGAMHIHSTFGNTQAAPAAGENGMTFLTASGVLQCYQNGGALVSCSFPLFNGTGTQQTVPHAVQDTCTLGTSCSVTLTGSSVYTSSTSYTCTAQDQTAAAATKVVQSSGSAFVVTGTGVDVIRFSCVGN